MKLTDAPASVAEADDPGQPDYAVLARRPSVRVIAVLWVVIVPAAISPHGSPVSAAVTIGAGDGLPPFERASRAVAVTHGGELLGALSLHKPPNEPLTSTEDELMRHLASQAGLVLRNAALTAELRATIDELRASRRRLVEAQDAELEESAANPAAVRELASAVKEGVRAALDDLRDLARGIYPPLLADQGLVPALQAQALKASLPVEIDADGIGRYPQDAEAAVYFCTLEALQNVTSAHSQVTEPAYRTGVRSVMGQVESLCSK